ncbi:ADP-forming succinate--CoA ligase subunit beta [bacterium]|nr:MAG: ADP-forming succinate--CoA ligase subunit beta [bacterium]
MNLYEYQAKEIFKKYGIPVPEEELARNPEEAERIAQRIGKVVVKAQVLVGGRGKAGGIKLAETPEDARKKAEEILGMEIKGIPVRKVLVSEACTIKSEAYMGVVVDRKEKKPCVMVSPEGGVDIEEVARKSPEKIFKLHPDPVYGLLPHQARELCFKLYEDPKLAQEASSILLKLYKVFVETDASLAEINPLALTDKGLIALDAKIVVDDNALFRHPDIEEKREIEPGEEKEIKAKEHGLSYIKLTGNIGCVVNGAGLAMATMDMIKHFGGEPANFLDIGGSSSPEKVRAAMEILLSDENVKVVWFNIFGGITRCDDVAQGMVQALREMDVKVPVVVRLTGTNEDKGRKILEDSNLPVYPVASMEEGAKKAIELGGK